MKIKVCQGINCQSKGSKNLLGHISQKLNLQVGECNENFCLDVCSCTAHCTSGINIRVDDKIAHMATVNNWQEKIKHPVEDIKREVDLDIKDDFLGDI